MPQVEIGVFPYITCKNQIVQMTTDSYVCYKNLVKYISK